MILNSASHFPKEFSEIVKEFKLGLWSTDLNLAIMTYSEVTPLMCALFSILYDLYLFHIQSNVVLN